MKKFLKTLTCQNTLFKTSIHYLDHNTLNLNLFPKYKNIIKKLDFKRFNIVSRNTQIQFKIIKLSITENTHLLQKICYINFRPILKKFYFDILNEKIKENLKIESCRKLLDLSRNIWFIKIS